MGKVVNFNLASKASHDNYILLFENKEKLDETAVYNTMCKFNIPKIIDNVYFNYPRYFSYYKFYSRFKNISLAFNNEKKAYILKEKPNNEVYKEKTIKIIESLLIDNSEYYLGDNMYIFLKLSFYNNLISREKERFGQLNTYASEKVINFIKCLRIRRQITKMKVAAIRIKYKFRAFAKYKKQLKEWKVPSNEIEKNKYADLKYITGVYCDKIIQEIEFKIDEQDISEKKEKELKKKVNEEKKAKIIANNYLSFIMSDINKKLDKEIEQGDEIKAHSIANHYCNDLLKEITGKITYLDKIEKKSLNSSNSTNSPKKSLSGNSPKNSRKQTPQLSPTFNLYTTPKNNIPINYNNQSPFSFKGGNDNIVYNENGEYNNDLQFKLDNNEFNGFEGFNEEQYYEDEGHQYNPNVNTEEQITLEMKLDAEQYTNNLFGNLYEQFEKREKLVEEEEQKIKGAEILNNYKELSKNYSNYLLHDFEDKLDEFNPSPVLSSRMLILE